MPNKISLAVFLKIFILGFFIAQFFSLAEKASAAEVCASATVNVVARNQSGAVIPGISYQISEAAVNSDGKVRPGKTVASGKIDAILGRGKSSFTPTGGNYVVKMYDKHSTLGAFYFYDQLTVACGEEKTFTGILSGLKIELRDNTGALRKNTSFTISQQAYDANEASIKGKGAAIATLNSDVYGQGLLYLADSSHTIDQSPISYVFSSPGYGGSEFILYDIVLEDKKTKEINYYFSEVVIKFRDKNTNSLPAGTKVQFLTKKISTSDLTSADKSIKEISIDSFGYVSFEYPAGTYFARIKKANGDYYNFPNIGIVDRTRTSLVLDAVDDSSQEVACTANSTLNVIARKASGGYISGIKIELYEKILNANNLPAGGALAAKGATDSQGNGLISFKPNLAKAYILKMYDKNPAAGAFWFYDEIKFTCGAKKNISKNLSSVTLTARDTKGSLMKDYNFSFYLQKKDVDDNALKIKDYLVADMKTNADGQATIYVSGGDPAQNQDIARYLISIKYNNLVFDKPDISITPEKDTQVNYALSGLNLTAVDAMNNNLSKGTAVNVYDQKTDENKNKILVKNVAKLTLDDYGKAVTALPAGVYALSFKDKGGNLMNLWDIKIENGLLNSKTVSVPLLRVYAVDGAGKSLSKIDVYIYSLIKNSDGWYQKNKNIYKTAITGLKYADIFLALGQYLVTVKQDAAEYGLAVDINNSSLKKVYVATKKENLVKPESVYKITAAVSEAEPPAAASAPSPLANRLKGYVLLQTEASGQAWYVNPKDKKRYYMRDGAASYEIMRNLGSGVKNSDLNKIPIGVLSTSGEADCDLDGLPDSLEKAIGTEACGQDSDSDGYSDSDEVFHNYDPLGPGKMKLDEKLAVKLSGDILLQVEANGEAWYVNPKDKKRYYLRDGAAALKIMKYLSLGITNANLNTIGQAN